MEAIKAIAKKTKTGKYKIVIPLTIIDEEIEVIVVLNTEKKKNKK